MTTLERTRYECPDDVPMVTDEMRRARQAIENPRDYPPIYSAKWKWVPKEYYSWPLEQRAQVLGAPSTWHLCKSLLLENHRLRNSNHPSGASSYDPTHPQFVLVVIQYETALDVKKLTYAVRSLRPPGKTRLDLNEFDFRVATLEDNAQWTGYSHGAVTPFGMLRQGQIPIFLHSNVVPLQFFWMGGGHVQLKLGMAVSEFLRATQAKVADISVPRNANLLVDDDE